MHGRVWTPHEDELLRKMWEGGVLIKAIGDKLKRTRSSVQHRRVRLGLHRRTSSPARVMIRLYLDPELARKTSGRAFAADKPVSAYIRSLILRDLGRM